MSDSTTPSLSQYFGSKNENKSDFFKDIVEASNKIGSLQLVDNKKNNKNEPEVCRIFSETPPQQKDPTAAFFDLIGNPAINSNPGGIVSDLGLSSADVQV